MTREWITETWHVTGADRSPLRHTIAGESRLSSMDSAGAPLFRIAINKSRNSRFISILLATLSIQEVQQ